MITEENATEMDEPMTPKPHSERGGRGEKQRSATPPTPEEYLPKLSTRLSIKYNGKQLPSIKVVALDFNLDYDDFNDDLFPVIYQKAGETYDPMAFEREYLKLKYAWISKVQFATLSKKPLLPHEYCDLDDASDYLALQLELQTKSAHRSRRGSEGPDSYFQIHATIIKASVLASPRTQLADAGNLSQSDISDSQLPGRNHVSFPCLMFADKL